VRCIENDDNDEVIAHLLADELDLSFIVGVPDNPNIEAWPLLVDPFVLVSPVGTGAHAVDPAELDGMPMIGQQPCSCQLAIDESLRSFGVEPDYVFRSNDNSAVQAMVRTGMGCAVLPYLAVDLNDPGVVVSQIDIPPRVVALARRRGRTLVPAADRFIELARSVCEGLQLPELLASSVG
jgi:DNA-binding transcriptional LysR family regulator